MRLTAASRYFHTLRHLKPVQFYGRLWFRYARPSPDLSPAPALRAIGPSWQPPATREPSLLGPSRFNFLNESGDLDEVGWTGEARSKLWRYNQHYFDDLNAQGATERNAWHQALLQRWVTENPPAQGDGWEPYPTSLRMVNWVKWSLVGNTLPPECVHSLAVQARWLMCRLEIHLLGNHLFANAKALVFAGCCLTGPEAERCLRTGFRILQRELPEQILADGGQFERSPMYHALALEDMLDLLNLLRSTAGQGKAFDSPALNQQASTFLDTWPDLIQSMLDWLHSMRHPDGEIAFFNDAALGVAPSCDELLSYAHRLGIREQRSTTAPVHLQPSGYIRLQTDSTVLLFDAAPVGPDYLPGHAHADTLSIEFSLFGQRLFVNSGASEYGLSAERLRQRGTAAHNTVVVNGENSSEVWSGFRVARRAYPKNIAVDLQGPVQTASACHTGYQRLSPPIAVCRKVQLQNNALLIEDTLQGTAESALAYFYLHPTVQATQRADDTITLHLPEGHNVTVGFEGAGSVVIKESTWHPRFGVTEANQCIVVTLAAGHLQTRIEWTP